MLKTYLTVKLVSTLARLALGVVATVLGIVVTFRR